MEIKKKYIFPMNYKKKEKFLGIIDYKVLVFCGIFLLSVFYIVKNLNIILLSKIVFFILFAGGPVIFMIIGINGENMVDFMYFILKYFIKSRIYVYKKIEEVTIFDKVYKKLVSYKKY